MKKIFIFILIFFVLSLVFLAGGYFLIQYQIHKAYSRGAIEKDFIIQKGESSRVIAQNLEKNKLIKNDFYFLFYLWQKKLSGKLQAGEYPLRSNMIIPEIADIFTQGKVKPNWTEVTIPEGFNIKKVDARLAEAGLIKEGEFINFKNFDLQIAGRKFQNLEGFLFPDTYRFDRNAGAPEMVAKMLDNFNQKISPQINEEIKKQKKDVYDILIIASILEKEVKTDEDRKIVAGIFWNRLEIGQPLESCATIAYILGIDKWRYSYEDTRIKSPYNTYLNKGLPPTPINNPGLSTILAAIYPIETDYNYFLTDPETEQTIFSKTFEEHNGNKAKYLK